MRNAPEPDWIGVLLNFFFVSGDYPKDFRKERLRRLICDRLIRYLDAQRMPANCQDWLEK